MSLLTLAFSAALAAPRATPVEWTVAGAPYSGFVVYDDATTDKRPGLVMVPNWMGVTPIAVDRAKAIAGTRYVVLVADVYGAKTRPSDNKEAGALAGALKADPPALRARTQAAVDALVAQAPAVPLDPTKLAAFGFCFGGTAALELARSGAALDGFVSFHGGLASPAPATAGAVKAPVLVLNGAADTYVSPQEIAAFQKEMTDAKADWQLVQLGGAVHCFAEPSAASPPGCVYDERAATRAYRIADGFFAEVLR